MGTEVHNSAAGSAAAPVIVYWRPGCPYCARLRWGLRRMKVATEELNIWTDPAASAFVRSVNGGDETVPTVVVAGEILVNPTPRQVKRELERQFPGTSSL
jgi:glutaredoxin-like protein